MQKTPVRAKAEPAGGDTPALRLFALLEVVASRDERWSLQRLVEETALPKPTLHRMLQQLEAAGLLQRESDGRLYGTGVRLRRLAESLLQNDSHHGARHAVLRRLVDEVGESCNLTALSGGEVIYLDRVETAAPLRFYLHPGSRVPAHCSASGKVFLAQMTPAQRQRLMTPTALEPYTPKTIVDAAALEHELQRVAADGYALDDEEFLPGLLCLAVAVPSAAPRSPLCVAIQAPVLRATAETARRWLPALKRAARALGAIDADGADAAANGRAKPPGAVRPPRTSARAAARVTTSASRPRTAQVSPSPSAPMASARTAQMSPSRAAAAAPPRSSAPARRRSSR